ncbi:PLP-dependent transferase [Neoconidiobolus thromboides FSU 785]|nr:PLP-dependent transferase [Neoconidiobolus thromboides FSU 785]
MNLKEGIDFSNLFTEEAKARKISPLKSLLKYTLDKENIYLASGLPRVDSFPIEEISIKVRDPVDNVLKEYVINKEEEESIGLNQAQQYGNGKGNLKLMKYFYEHTNLIHQPKYKNWNVIPSAGNTDALYKMLILFFKRHMPILISRWAYPTALETFSGFGLQLLILEMDEQGIIPDSLDKVVQEWNQNNPDNCCKFIYIVPCGQNPTGATMGLQRRQEIYKLAQKYNLLIIEDDPYYYLQLPEDINLIDKQEINTKHDEFKYNTLLPSFLSLDVDGRVIRFDSVAKILAPGFRVGWITCQQNMIDKLQYINEVSIQFPSGHSQALLSKILIDAWKQEKYEIHIANIRKEFYFRRNIVIQQINKRLGNMVSYSVPKAGMFLWLKPNLPKKLLNENNQVNKATMEALFNKLVEHHIIIVPGVFFDSINFKHDNDLTLPGAPYIRLCYTFANLDLVLDGIDRIANTLKDFGCE